MKRTLSIVVFLSMIFSLLLAGCSQTGKDASAQSSTAAISVSSTGSASAPKYMQKALKMTDEEWVNKLYDLDTCVLMDPYDQDSRGLTFSDPKEIPSETLFMFFCYIAATDEYPYSHYKWYGHSDDGLFHVPVSDVKEVLNKYFENCNFEPEKVKDYNPETNCIENYWEEEEIGGGPLLFGNAELIKKEQISNDTLRITVRFYTNLRHEVRYTKAYTIKFTDDGYKYESIVKV